MAILQKTQITGRVEAILINDIPAHGIATRSIGSVAVSFDGLAGDWHSTQVRDACIRTRRQYKIGTPIRNTRQVTIVSVEELAKIAKKMNAAALTPEDLGANLVLSGIPDLTQVRRRHG